MIIALFAGKQLYPILLICELKISYIYIIDYDYKVFAHTISKGPHIFVSHSQEIVFVHFTEEKTRTQSNYIVLPY